jgi:ferredoxin-thioredoxin reductase catalytic subunit
MMILASAVESAIKQDNEVEMLMRQVMQKVNTGDYISDKDNEVVKDTIEALLDTSANAPDYR